MTGLTAIVRRLRAMVSRNRRDYELEEEIRLHLDLRAQSLIDRGLEPNDAAAEARRQFGNVLARREDARDAWSVRAIDEVLQNVRFGLRLLGRSPAFTIVAVLSLGIGTGASAAVFSLADALLFKKLPVRAPDELVTFQWSSGPKPPTTSLTGNMISNDQGFSSTSFSRPLFQELRRAAGTAELFAFGDFWGGLNFSSDGRPDVVSAQVVSGNYFNVLGLVPAAGRLIGESDDRPDALPVAVISHRFWQRRFGLSPSAIGKPITVNNMPVTIIGVAPKGFHGTLEAGASPELTLPIASRSTIEHDGAWNSTHLWWLVIMGRFHSGQSPAEALTGLDGAFKQFAAAANPELTSAELPRLHVLAGAHGQTDARESRREVLTIMALVAGVLLLVASANVASLLLVRGTARAREVAMRVAIGASRARVVRQFLTEAMMLSAFGTAVGILISEWIARGLVAALDAGAGDVMELAVNARLLAFAAVLGTVCCALFGLVPALRTTRAMTTKKGASIHLDGRGAVGSDRRAALVNSLVLVQVALSVLLASLGGVLSYSVWSLQRISPGFDASNLLIFTVYPLRNGYEVPHIRSTYEAATARLEALPGVRSATFSTSALIGGGGSTTVALPLETPIVPRSSDEYRRLERANGAWRLIVGDRFFETMGIALLRGRTFSGADAAGAAIPRVVINRRLARKLFNDDGVVGRHFKTGVGADAPVVEIIGVVADAKYAFLRREPPPTIYGSYRQDRVSNVTFEVKTSGDPLALAPLVIEAMSQVDPNLPLASMRTQEQQIERSMSSERLVARLAIALGGLSALLSAIGLYGLLAYAVTRRVPEIGVRMALGAARERVLWLFLRPALVIATAGAILGLGAAFAASGLVQALLFGVSPTDPTILAAAATINFGIALLAAYVPARRAARIDPVVALRAE